MICGKNLAIDHPKHTQVVWKLTYINWKAWICMANEAHPPFLMNGKDNQGIANIPTKASNIRNHRRNFPMTKWDRARRRTYRNCVRVAART